MDYSEYSDVLDGLYITLTSFSLVLITREVNVLYVMKRFLGYER